jgi:hypothetical protein
MLSGSSDASTGLPTNKKQLQQRLIQLCERIFESKGISSEAEAALFDFLSRAPLSNLDFNDSLDMGPCKGATVFAVLSRAAMVGRLRCVEKVLGDSAVLPKLKFNVICKNPLFVGVSPLYFLGFAALNGNAGPLRTVFTEYPLKDLHFNVTCQSGPYQGTNLLWLLGLLGIKGQPVFIEEVLTKVPLSRLELDSTCRSGSIDGLNDPFLGESLYHHIAELATQNRPLCLQRVWDKMLETPNIFNAKTLAGPNKGMTVFQQVLESAARVNALELKDIPKKWLPGLIFNSKVQGGQSRGTDALYWAGVLAGKSDPSFLEKILVNVPFEKLSFHVASQEPAYQGLNFLWWLCYTASKRRSKALIKVMAPIKFTPEECNAKCLKGTNVGATALFWLTMACVVDSTNDLLTCLDKVLNEEDILQLDFNTRYQGEHNKGTTPLWWIALLAAKGHPAMLKRVLSKVPLSKLDLTACCEDGENQGWTVMHLICEAATRGDDESLMQIINSGQMTPGLLNTKQLHGEHKGMSVLIQSIQAASRGQEAALRSIFAIPGMLNQLDFSARCEGGPYQGTKPFWWLALTAVNGYPEFLEKALEEIEFTFDDLNTTCEAGDLEGSNAFYFIVYLARLGHPKALIHFLSKVPLHKIDFYKQCANGANEGMSPLWWFIVLAAQGNPEYLQFILHEIDFSKADLNIPVEQGRYKGTTLLMWISVLALLGYQQPLLQVFRQVPLYQLNFNAYCEASIHKGVTVLWTLAAIGSIELISRVLHEVPLTELNFNSKAQAGPNAGISILWWLTLYAIQGNSQFLDKVLNDVPLTMLDFTSTRKEDGTSITDLVKGTPLQSKLDFVTHLQEAMKLARRKNVACDRRILKNHLVETEKLAEAADKEGHQDAYFWLARFYLEREEQENFIRVAPKISPHHQAAKDMQAEVERIELEILSKQMASASIKVADDVEVEPDVQSHDSKNLTQTRLHDKISELSSSLEALQIQKQPLAVAFIPPKNLIFHDIRSSKITEPVDSANDAENDVKVRSFGARKLHRLVMRVCDATNEDSLQAALKNLEQCVDQAKPSELMELSVNGYSHLEDALHLPFVRQQDVRFADIIANQMFTMLSHKMKEKLSNHQFASIIENSSIQGMNLLQQALRYGSRQATQSVIKISESCLSTTEWQEILQRSNEFGYNVFHQAVASGDPVIVNAVIGAVNRAFDTKSEGKLIELGSETRRLFSGKRWRESPHQQAIMDLISPFVNCAKIRKRNY